jgi:hypothetical protein
VKRSTAIAHLVEMAEVASHWLEVDGQGRWPLSEMWVTGELLTLTETLDAGAVVLVLDRPTEELPWLAIHSIGESIGHQLRLGKRPILWCYRPRAWPVWNCQHRRLAKFWSAEDGLDSSAIDALRSRRLDRLDIVEPSADELVEQLREELAVSRRHLQSMLGHYWEHDWRLRHKHFDERPEDHLWRAASAVADILDALDDRKGCC